MCTPARRGGRCDLMRSQVMRKSIRFIGPVSESKHTPLFRSIESCRVPCERSPCGSYIRIAHHSVIGVRFPNRSRCSEM